MASKLLKHLGLGGGKKTSSPSAAAGVPCGSGGGHRPGAAGGEYNAQKSNSVQELQPRSPTRCRSSVSLANHQEYDTQSLRSFSDGPPSSAAASSSAAAHGGGGSNRFASGLPSSSSRCRDLQLGSLNPKASCGSGGDGHCFASQTGIAGVLIEESEVSDSAAREDGNATLSKVHTATPVIRSAFASFCSF